MSLDWQGEALLRRVAEASRAAIDETIAAAVPVAQGLVHVDTGLLKSRIGTVPAEVTGDVVVGAFGVPDDPGYAIPQEYAPEPHGKAFIRPAFDQVVPDLPKNIAKRLGQ